MGRIESNKYEIVDVDDSNKNQYCICLEDWSDEIKEAGDRKCLWYEHMKDKGLGVKMVKDETGELSGMIQYLPAAYSPLEGEDFYYIYCIWVHGHKKGMGNKQGRGMGSALLKAAEEDIASRGAGGIAAWGLTLPIWMKASWYRKHGYSVIEKDGIRRLLWKPLKPGVTEPQWLKPAPVPGGEPGKVTVTSLVNGVCPVTNLANVRAKAVCEEMGDNVVFREISLRDPEEIAAWKCGDSLYFNDKELPLGPPLSKKKIRKMIIKEQKRLS